jgi:HK97 family phage major capsid protein
MKPVTQLQEAQQRHAESIEKMEEWDAKIQALPDEADAEERAFFDKAFKAAEAESHRWEAQIERLEAMVAARRAIPASDDDDKPADDKNGTQTAPGSTRITVGQEPRTYSPHTSSQGRSFFADLYEEKINGNHEARTRLQRHMEEVAVEKRAISTTVTAGGNFVPPGYLGELYANFPRAGRPFADAIPIKLTHEPGGPMAYTIPRITTGTTVGSIATENSTTVSSTDIVEAMLSVPVRTIAGQQDVSQQLLDHSQPGIDQVIFADLRSAYDAQLDTQLLNGAGTSGTHLGIRAVSGVNAITYTQATPTAALTVPPIYNGIQSVFSNRFMPADLIVMHPRRSAFLASNLSSTFPLFQLGNLVQAAGVQDQGMVNNFSGLGIVIDANVRSTDGAGTNQDEIYVLRSQDLVLWEGELQARVMSEVLSNTLTVRLQLYAYSAFASGRFPKSISVISGTGLVAPSF